MWLKRDLIQPLTSLSYSFCPLSIILFFIHPPIHPSNTQVMLQSWQKAALWKTSYECQQCILQTITCTKSELQHLQLAELPCINCSRLKSLLLIPLLASSSSVRSKDGKFTDRYRCSRGENSKSSSSLKD